MRPVPDELWQSIQRRHELCATLLKIGTWANAIAAGLILLSPMWFLVRVSAPFAFFALLTGALGIVLGKRNLARARQLMIEYHGVDPGPPP